MEATNASGPSSRVAYLQTSDVVRRVLGGSPAFPTAEFDAANSTWDFVRILVVGAGGIGCELAHLLALSGFGELTIIDMDTVELSNLNRQFLFQEADIGLPKSVVAARRLEARCPGVTVRGVFSRIEEQPDDFYRSFDLIVMGLDSVAARRWMNKKVAQLAAWEMEVDEPHEHARASPSSLSSVAMFDPPVAHMRIVQAIPLIDTGTEGLQGHVKFIDMARRGSSCVECQMWMYDDAAAGGQRRQVPMCTLENIPRAPEHCVLYVQFKSWPDEHPEGTPLDGDNVDHIRWVAARARERQKAFGIGGAVIDEVFAMGVVKNVVPAVSFTNAMIAGMAVTEVLKWLTGVAPALNNYYLYDGAASSVNVEVPGAQRLVGCPADGAPYCSVCGPRPVLTIWLGMAITDVRAAFVEAAFPPLPPSSSSSLLATRAREREEALEGTLSLLYDPSNAAAVAAGSGTHPQSEVSPVAEVFLAFKIGSPLATPIHGTTLAQVLSASGAEGLVHAWQQQHKVPDQRVAVTAMLTAGQGRTVSMPLHCAAWPVE